MQIIFLAASCHDLHQPAAGLTLQSSAIVIAVHNRCASDRERDTEVEYTPSDDCAVAAQVIPVRPLPPAGLLRAKTAFLISYIETTF